MNKIKVLNEEDIKKILNMELAITAVEKAYAQKSNNKGSVWPLVFYEYEHNIFDLDIRSGNLDDSKAYGLKLISYNENNPAKGFPKINATSLIFDSITGEPIALLNAAPITLYRTGAAAALGVKYLAKKDANNLLIVGCGNVAIYSIAAILLTTPNIEKVTICNPKNPDTALQKLENIKKEVEKLLKECGHNLNVNIIAETDIEICTRTSDIVVTATPSEKAMIKSDWVKEGTHFSCMGAGMEGKQEIDENLFLRAKSFADDIPQCLKAGEAQTAYKNNVISTFDGEIGEIILKKKTGRTSEKDITIFDSTGLFIQDLSTSIELLKNSNDIGKEIML